MEQRNKDLAPYDSKHHYERSMTPPASVKKGIAFDGDLESKKIDVSIISTLSFEEEDSHTKGSTPQTQSPLDVSADMSYHSGLSEGESDSDRMRQVSVSSSMYSSFGESDLDHM